MSTFGDRIQLLKSDIGLYLSRRRDRKLLLRLDDRILADINISRELLDAGISAWPWRVTAEDRAVGLLSAHFRNAVKELESYSDVELADLGITRGTIAEAVLHGRPGIDVATNDNGLAQAA